MERHDTKMNVMEGRAASGRRVEPVLTGPSSGKELRFFALEDTSGDEVRLRQYRSRGNVIIFLFHGVSCAECRQVLAELATGVDRYHELDASVVAIGPDAPATARDLAERMDLPFRLLSDPVGEVASDLGLSAPAIVVLDRYGEVWVVWSGGAEHHLPEGTEIDGWLKWVQMQCPE